MLDCNEERGETIRNMAKNRLLYFEHKLVHAVAICQHVDFLEEGFHNQIYNMTISEYAMKN